MQIGRKRGRAEVFGLTSMQKAIISQYIHAIHLADGMTDEEKDKVGRECTDKLGLDTKTTHKEFTSLIASIITVQLLTTKTLIDARDTIAIFINQVNVTQPKGMMQKLANNAKHETHAVRAMDYKLDEKIRPVVAASVTIMHTLNCVKGPTDPKIIVVVNEMYKTPIGSLPFPVYVRDEIVRNLFQIVVKNTVHEWSLAAIDEMVEEFEKKLAKERFHVLRQAMVVV